MAAVEDHHFAQTGHHLVNAPQVIVCTLLVARGFPAHGAHAQRTDAAKYAAQRAILARRVSALQDHQQFVAFVGIKQVLQRIEFHRQCFDRCLVVLLVAS